MEFWIRAKQGLEAFHQAQAYTTDFSADNIESGINLYPAVAEQVQEFCFLQLKLQKVQEPQNFSTLVAKSKLNSENLQRLAEFVQLVDLKLNTRDINCQTWLLSQQKALQFQLKVLEIKIARELRANQYSSMFGKLSDQNSAHASPIWSAQEQILNLFEDQALIPLQVFWANSILNVSSEQNSVSELANNVFFNLSQKVETALEDLFNTYSAQGRLIKLWGGDWLNTAFHGESAIATIFTTGRTAPTLIVETALTNENFELACGYWGLNWSTYRYQTVLLELNCRECLNKIAKQNAVAWKLKLDEAIATKQDPEELEKGYKLSEIQAFFDNLRILESLKNFFPGEADSAQSDQSTPIKVHFNCSAKDYIQLQEMIANYCCIMAGLHADEYFLLHLPPKLRSRPLLPDLLPKLLSHISEPQKNEITRLIALRYQYLYKLVSDSESAWLPELALDLAISLSHLGNSSWSIEQVVYSLRAWLNLHKRSQPEDVLSLWQAVQSELGSEDREYVGKLKQWIAAITNTESNPEDFPEADREIANWQKAITNYIQTNSSALQGFDSSSFSNFASHPSGENPLQIEIGEFTFTVAKLTTQATETYQLEHCAKFFAQSLSEMVTLEMISLPTGVLYMGSPMSEISHDQNEMPQHWVVISHFFMGKFPITQAQWQVVAGFPQVNRFLHPDPSHFKGADRPEENVSWYDAVEFCDRLHQKTKLNYRLPAEAEWEYACRAGTNTPFHFGNTISTQLANYDGSYSYGFGLKGEYRQETTDVGSFQRANAFGLYDMHGLVSEWCADAWHENYQGAPTQGETWLSDVEPIYRVLRGGSWFSVPGRCRSAVRRCYLPEVWLNQVGFRVALSL